MGKEYKELADICLNSVLFEIAIKNRVDFFEIIRCDNVHDYNRENPLCPLDEKCFIVLKNRAKEIIKNGQ